jgi:hypothetical protein
MSFVHYSIVGHFNPDDPESISPRHAPVPTRFLDADRFAELLASYGEEVSQCVVLRDGYACCEWSSDRSRRTFEFAERLADAEGAIVLESPFHVVRYPPEAAQRFLAASMVLADDNFASITAAVREGRTVYNNIEKAILFLLALTEGPQTIIRRNDTAIVLSAETYQVHGIISGIAWRRKWAMFVQEKGGYPAQTPVVVHPGRSRQDWSRIPGS